MIKFRAMSRQRYKHPKVYLWHGKTAKYWKAEWHDEQGRHISKTWPSKEFTKSEAQTACDQSQANPEPGLPQNRDMSIRVFWTEVFFPIVQARLAIYSRNNYRSAWNKHLEPYIGELLLRDVTKHAIECILVNMAKAGHGESIIKRVRDLAHKLFVEAEENGLILRNPCRNIQLPRCKANRETTPLTEGQVQAIFEATSGRDRLMWKLLFLTGCRPGELFALEKADLGPDGLRIDESATWGKIGTTKNRKTRIAPLTSELRGELLGWIAKVPGHMMFPSARGCVLRLNSDEIVAMLERTRIAVNLPSLTFRQARTTFATLYEGDPKDLQAILGHYDAKLTMEVYRKQQVSRQQDSVEALAKRLKVVQMPKRESA